MPYLCRTHCPTQAGRGQPKRPQAHRGEGTRHLTMTLLLPQAAATIPYLCGTHCPRTRGGANQKDHRPHPTGGGRGRGQTRPPRKTGNATRPNKTTTHLTGKGGGGIPWGGRGGVQQPCIMYSNPSEFCLLAEKTQRQSQMIGACKVAGARIP